MSSGKNIRTYLMTGVSYMIPAVTAGGILIALAFWFGGVDTDGNTVGTVAGWLMQIGGSAFGLMVPILAGYIAYAMADRPGIVPGLVAGQLAVNVGAGFLGGIIGGLLAGFVVSQIKKIKVSRAFTSLMPVLIIPLLATLIVGLLMVTVIGTPIKAVMDGLTNWMSGISGINAILLGIIIGLMMAFDMGGPVNKVAFGFGLAMISVNVFEPHAAVMAAGMTPPLGLALATVLAKKKYTVGEREAGKSAWVLGASFITEGAIPFAAADPLRVIPSIMVGSAVAGALSMALGIGLMAPHGGIFVIPLMKNAILFPIPLIVGSVVTALMVNALKKPVTEEEDEADQDLAA